MGKPKRSISKKLKFKFDKFEENYNLLKEKVDDKKIMLAIDGYAKGFLFTYLEERKIIKPRKDLTTSDCFKGMAAAPGYAKGKSFIFDPKTNIVPTSRTDYVLCADSRFYRPEYASILVKSLGVITCNTGITGHIPVLCRGLRKGCVILSEKDFYQLIDNDKVILSGGQGLVFTGLFVEI